MQKFTNNQSKFLPKISIRRRTGYFALSKGFINCFELNEGKWFASLFYKKKTKTIGIQFSQTKKMNALPLRKYKSNPREITITAKNFLDFHKIDYYSGKRITVIAKKNREGLITFQLPQNKTKQTDSLRKNQLRKFLLEKSVQFGSFTLSSGQQSDFYVDCRKTSMDPRGGILIGKLGWKAIRLYAHKLKIELNSIGGLTMGADPIAFAIANTATNEKTFPVLQTFSIRKESKNHGAKKQIEGNFEKGDSVVIVDDVITTGNSAIQAIDAVKKGGGEVAFVFSLVDREEKGKEEIEKKGVDVISLFRRSDLEE